MNVGSPKDWNAVVLGAWNPAIFTPKWISEQLFENPTGTPVDVQIALDRPAPMRVTHQGVAFVPTLDRLLAACLQNDLVCLNSACKALTRALTLLPVTPVVAAGINVRFHFTSIPPILNDHVASSLDELLEGEPRRSALKRSTPWENGRLNLELVLDQEQVSSSVNYNFELAGRTEDLEAWLHKTSEMVDYATRFTSDVLKLEIEEPND